jgi:DNA-binding NarL/FixJ family response regulator
MTSVLIVDDQPLVRLGLRRILESDPAMTLVGEAADGSEAVRCAHELVPDVVLMDIRMPVLDGIEATRQLITAGHPSAIIMLTTFGTDEYVLGALRAGASAFVLKEAPPEEILAAIRQVSVGRAVLDPGVTRVVIDELGRRPVRHDLQQLLERLTDREHEVLRLLAQGLSNSEIADRLFLGEGTVKTHIAHVLTKLGVRDRLQAVILAFDAGAL